MNNILTARGKIILSLIIFLIVCVIGYFTYLYLHPVQIFTGESQQQAETVQGISLAAHNAYVSMKQSQLNEAAQQIALLKDKSPDTIIKTTPVDIINAVEKEVEKSDADFSVVTDPQQPDNKVDLKEISRLPARTDVTLNQYNVFAYKKIIRGINVYPRFTGITPTGLSEVTYDLNRKITNDGKYIGITGGYDFDNKKAKIGLRYTF
jgi:Tfp pilus assembly protein PilO